jgi:hypothetical protein
MRVRRHLWINGESSTRGHASPITGEKIYEPLLPYWSMKAAQPLETSLNTFHMASGFAEASRPIVSMTSIFSE